VRQGAVGGVHGADHEQVFGHVHGTVHAIGIGGARGVSAVVASGTRDGKPLQAQHLFLTSVRTTPEGAAGDDGASAKTQDVLKL
jgi:hypothetical protein